MLSKIIDPLILLIVYPDKIREILVPNNISIVCVNTIILLFHIYRYNIIIIIN